MLLYFDSFLVGLTATPAGKTIGFFNQNLVMQYGQRSRRLVCQPDRVLMRQRQIVVSRPAIVLPARQQPAQQRRQRLAIIRLRFRLGTAMDRAFGWIGHAALDVIGVRIIVGRPIGTRALDVPRPRTWISSHPWFLCSHTTSLQFSALRITLPPPSSVLAAQSIRGRVTNPCAESQPARWDWPAPRRRWVAAVSIPESRFHSADLDRGRGRSHVDEALTHFLAREAQAAMRAVDAEFAATPPLRPHPPPPASAAPVPDARCKARSQ